MALARDDLARRSLWSGPGALLTALASLAVFACTTPGVDTVATTGVSGLPQIAVQAPIGLPQTQTARLGDQVISALESRSVTMAPTPDAPAQYKLQGFCSASEEGTQTSIACVWDANTQDGTRAHRIITEDTVRGSSPAQPWSVVSDATLDQMASSVANGVAAWLPGAQRPSPSGGITLPTLSSLGLTGGSPPPVTVNGVRGAPGDGNEALARAMASALRSENVPVTGASGRAFRLAGTVAVAEAGPRTESVTIEWTLVDPEGNARGTITQRNEIPRGALNGAWGGTADASASAAAKRVSQLLADSS